MKIEESVIISIKTLYMQQYNLRSYILRRRKLHSIFKVTTMGSMIQKETKIRSVLLENTSILDYYASMAVGKAEK